MNKYYVALSEPVNQMAGESSQAHNFYTNYSEKSAMAAQDLSELIGSYLRVKTNFRVIWDVCDQFNECKEEEDTGLQDKLDINISRNGGGSAAAD